MATKTKSNAALSKMKKELEALKILVETQDRMLGDVMRDNVQLNRRLDPIQKSAEEQFTFPIADMVKQAYERLPREIEKLKTALDIRNKENAEAHQIIKNDLNNLWGRVAELMAKPDVLGCLKRLRQRLKEF